MALAQSARPIRGAVATLGVSDRVVFLRKTYGLLGGALIAWAAITGGLLRFAPDMSWKFSKFAFSGGGTSWLLVMVGFMGVGYISQKLAMSPASRATQIAGLALTVLAWSFLLQPLLWLLMVQYGGASHFIEAGSMHPYMSPEASALLAQAIGITLTIFIGLTLVVFLTKKDFSFLRGALTIASFGMLAVIVLSCLFGFHLGMLFTCFGILVLAGTVLFQTSVIMAQFPPQSFVAAALMLFGTVATLFWYVLTLLMQANRR
ncbi:MAG TPA: Bax inhibitor-1 family protein [Kofleriaceae bacterium]|jgi:hypothetical protein